MIKNRSSRISLVLIIAWLAGGCVPAPAPSLATPLPPQVSQETEIKSLPSATLPPATITLPPVTPSLPVTTVTPALTTQASSKAGYLYFVARDAASLTLMWLPAGCLDPAGSCPAPEGIAGYPNKNGPVFPLSWSADGRFAALVATDPADQRATLYLFNPADGSWKSLGKFDYLDPALFWSPDNQWIAFSGQQGPRSLFVIHPDGSGFTDLTHGKPDEREMIWLGGWIKNEVIFSAGKAGEEYPYRVRPGEPPQRIADVPVFQNILMGHPLLLPSPDGKSLVYLEQGKSKSWRMLILNADGSDSREVVSANESTVNGYAWSPNNDWLAYWTQAETSTTVSLVHPDGSARHDIFNANQAVAANVVFSPVGDVVIVETEDAGGRHLTIVPYGLGAAHPLQAAGLDPRLACEGVSWQPPAP